MFWFMFEILNKWMWEDIVGIKIFWMNNKLFLYVIPTKKFIVVFIFIHIQNLKFNSSIKLYLFGSPHNDWSTYITDLNRS